jgi:hypothetical protein
LWLSRSKHYQVAIDDCEVKAAGSGWDVGAIGDCRVEVGRVGSKSRGLEGDRGYRGLVADAAFYGGVAFAGVDDDFLFFAFLVVHD